MVPRHMKNQIIKKKQAHCLQAIGKVILGLPWQAIICLCLVMVSRTVM